MSAEVQLVTDDMELVAIVGAHLAPHAFVRLLRLDEAGIGEPAPIVIVDVRTRVHASAVRRLRLRHPRALCIAVVAPSGGPRNLYVEGATAVITPDGRAIAACCSTLLGARS